jgi:hypothetical protein
MRFASRRQEPACDEIAKRAPARRNRKCGVSNETITMKATAEITIDRETLVQMLCAIAMLMRAYDTISKQVDGKLPPPKREAPERQRGSRRVKRKG